ncbi:MAG: YncE family protein [Balneolales bacterium]|nr:YncE family protein [Balneolales bacterium]
MSRPVFFTFILLLFLCVDVKAQNYYAYVAAESEDEVHLIHFDAESKKVEIAKTIPVGRYPAENDGPHGMTVSPDGKYWFVSIAHGNPYGWLAKYKTGSDELIGTVDLGLFPATMEISEQTGLLYVVNFNLHGEMEPSSVMVVDYESMDVLDEIETGIMPHGSRMNSSGTRKYHVSMMTDELIEINTTGMSVERRLSLGKNAMGMEMGSMGNMDHSSMGHGHMEHNPVEKPTWVDPHPTKPLVYIAGNGSDEIIEVHTDNWEITRRFNSGKAPYNLEVSPDGKLLVVSYKGEAATGIWDLESGSELAKIPSTRKVTHGVTVTPDSKFAFITVEGIGGEPGSVEIIDLEKRELVDYVETGKQAGGIYFWKQVN